MRMFALVNWVSSMGGPLVVVPEVLFDDWRGGEGEEYEKACEIDLRVGLMQFRAGEVLVLGDVPDDTTYLPGEMSFLRWGGADSEQQLVSWVQRGCPGGREVQNFLWSCKGSSVLFDSILPAGEVEDFIKIPLTPGSYNVQVFSHEGEFFATCCKLTLC